MFWTSPKTKGPQSYRPIGGIDEDWIVHYLFTVLTLLDQDEAMPNRAGAVCRNAPVTRADEMPCPSIASRLLWTEHLGELDSQRGIVTIFQESPESEDRRIGDQVGDFGP